MNFSDYRHFFLIAALALIVSCYDVDASYRRRRRSRRRSSASAPRIHPHSLMKVTTFRSSIIKSQAMNGFPSNFERVLIGSATTYSDPKRAPVYRGLYPMFYKSFINIPNRRAIRLQKREVRVTDVSGGHCADVNRFKGYEYFSSNDEYLETSQTTVDYGNTKEKGGGGITLDATRSGADITMKSESNFSKPVIAGTTCTRVVVTITATIVKMYETNPYASGAGGAGPGAVQGSVVVAFLILLLLELQKRWR